MTRDQIRSLDHGPRSVNQFSSAVSKLAPSDAENLKASSLAASDAFPSCSSIHDPVTYRVSVSIKGVADQDSSLVTIPPGSLLQLQPYSVDDSIPDTRTRLFVTPVNRLPVGPLGPTLSKADPSRQRLSEIN